jgi:hypothetical protein
VAGRRRDRKETPAIELVVCPECRSMRRMVLPPTVGAPFRIVSADEKVRDE